MLSTTFETFERAWPPTHLGPPREVLIDGPTERVVEGVSETTGAWRIVSLRDLGADARAGRWAGRLRTLLEVESPALARLVGARIVDERFIVLETKRPHGVTVHARLQSGPLDPGAAIAVARAALRACEDLNEAGLSAAGIRLASAVLDETQGAGTGVQLTTYGLHVDLPMDPVSELREVALRTLALVGATTGGLGSAIRIPTHALPPVVGELLREAAGLVPEHPISSAHELAAALRVAIHAH